MADTTTNEKIISLGTLSYNNDKMKEYIQGEIDNIPSSVVDDTLSDTSEHPVQNKVIKAALDTKVELSDIPTTLPANGGNSDTVNGKTVEMSVYRNLSSLGVTKTDAAGTIWNAIPPNSIFMIEAKLLTHFSWCFPSEIEIEDYSLVMIKLMSNMFTGGIYLYPKNGYDILVGSLNYGGEYTGTWHSLRDSDTSISARQITCFDTIGTGNDRIYKTILDWANNNNYMRPGTAWAFIRSDYGCPADAPEQSDAIVKVETDETGTRKLVTFLSYASDVTTIYYRTIYDSAWSGEWHGASGGSAVDEVARTAARTHAENAEIHVTADEKASWNGKADISDIPSSLPANGGNADTVGGRSVSGLNSLVRFTYQSADINTLLSTGLYSGTFTNYPEGVRDGQGTVIVINYLNHNEEVSGTISEDILWIRQLFVSAHGGQIYERTAVEREVSAWTAINNGGNAATLETHPASDFVLKSDYDALAARVAALESK